jgi:hypothetical protein
LRNLHPSDARVKNRRRVHCSGDFARTGCGLAQRQNALADVVWHFDFFGGCSAQFRWRWLMMTIRIEEGAMRDVVCKLSQGFQNKSAPLSVPAKSSAV